MQGTRMSFRTKEDAIHFAEKQGVWCQVSFSMYGYTDVIVRMGLLSVCRLLCHCLDGIADLPCLSQPEPTKRIPAKNYAENYVYKPGKLRICRTK